MSQLRKGPFSFSLDEGSDGLGKKYLDVIASFVYNNYLKVSKVYDVIQFGSDYTDLKLFEMLDLKCQKQAYLMILH